MISQMRDQTAFLKLSFLLGLAALAVGTLGVCPRNNVLNDIRH